MKVKTDLVTSIVAAVIGVIMAYFICNLLIPPIADVSFKSVDSTVSTDLVDPDPEVFNYKALNPTVEVYVGDCAEYNDKKECVEEVTEIPGGDIPEENQSNQTEQSDQTAPNSTEDNQETP